MKKINLILSAVAAVALLASCSNGSKDYKDVTTQNYKYAYTVTGSMTTTNKSGTTTAYSTNVEVQTIKNAVAECSYEEDSINESNYDAYKIKIKGTADYVNTYTAAGATTATPSTKWTDKFGSLAWNSYEQPYTLRAGYYLTTIINSITLQASSENEGYYMLSHYSPATKSNGAYPLQGDAEFTDDTDPNYHAGYTWVPAHSGTIDVSYSYIADLTFRIQDFDGDYFIQFNNEFIPLPEDAFDGFIGDDEFTLTYSTTKDNRGYLNETNHTNAAGALNTTDVEYKLTFKLVEAE